MTKLRCVKARLDICAEVPNSERVVDIAAIQTAARELRESLAATTCSYLILCRAVRAAQIQPALLRQILRAEGYAAPRIAEIASVCFCSAELFADYESRLLGWRAVLRRIRTARGDDRHQRAWLRFERSLQELDRLAVAAEGLEVGALVGVVICPSQCVMGRAYKLDVGRTCVSVSVDVAKETKKTNEKIRVNGKSP